MECGIKAMSNAFFMVFLDSDWVGSINDMNST